MVISLFTKKISGRSEKWYALEGDRMKLTEIPKYYKSDKITPIPGKSEYYEDEDGWLLRISIYPEFTVSEFGNPNNKHFCRPTIVELK